jgi:multicomponent K+:H+ antiporter subunit G
MAEIITAVLILVGAAFALLGSVGLARLPNFFTRLHGPTKATTLGVGAIVIASSLHFTNAEAGVSLHELAVTVFLFITAPVTAHLLAKAALHRQPQGDASTAYNVRDGAERSGESRLE